MASMAPTVQETHDAFPPEFVAPLYMGAALNPINTSLIATALVPIATAMDVSVGKTSALVAGVYLASAIALPTAGRLAEEFGARRILIIGTLIVLLGGLLGGLAQSFEVLVASRVIIGIGTSAGYPCAMLLIRRRAASINLHSPPGPVLGGMSIAAQVTVTVGLPLGGLLVGAWGWRATFFANVPFALAVLVMLLLWVPEYHRPGGPRSRRETLIQLDLPGLAGFATLLISLLLFLMMLDQLMWPLLVVAGFAGAALVWWELRATTPFFDVRELVENAPLARSYLRFALALFGMYLMLYGLAQWLEAAKGVSAERTGMLIVPMTLVGAITSRVVSKRTIIRGSLVTAALTAIIASTAALFLDSQSPTWWIIVITIFFGVSIGTNSFGNQAAMYAQARPSRIGTASGLLRTFGYLGSIGSTAVTAYLFRSTVTDAGMHTIAIILLISSFALLALTAADRSLRSLVGSPNTLAEEPLIVPDVP